MAGLERVSFDGALGPVATLPDGRIVSLYTENTDLFDFGRPRDESWAYTRYSRDGGRTWSEPTRAYAHAAGLGVEDSFLPLVDRDGRLHAFGTRYFGVGRDGFPPRSVVIHCRSDDGGATWTRIQPVDFGHDYTGWLNSAIQLASGRILLPLSYLDESRTRDRFVSLVCYSDDSGDTWRQSNDLHVASGSEYLESGAIEPVVVQLASGIVWLLLRTQTGYLWESFSSDGADWTAPRGTRIVASNAPAGVLRLRDDRIALVWNNVFGEPFRQGASYARFQLHGAISDDDAQTWSRPKVIAERQSGEPTETHVRYPYLCQVPDGWIVTRYTRVRVWLDHREYQTELVRLDPEWLASRTDTVRDKGE